MKAFKGPHKQLGFWGAVVGALGAVGSAVLSSSGASARNQAQIAASREQMAFQERMSSTAYQRSAKDLEAAGLNRILALGSPSSTPQGAQAQIQDELGPAVSSAQQALQLSQQVKRMTAETKNIKQATAVAKRTEEKEFSSVGLNDALKHESNNRSRVMDEQLLIMKRAVQESKIDEAFLRKYPWMRVIERFLPVGSSAKNLFPMSR